MRVRDDWSKSGWTSRKVFSYFLLTKSWSTLPVVKCLLSSSLVKFAGALGGMRVPAHFFAVASQFVQDVSNCPMSSRVLLECSKPWLLKRQESKQIPESNLGAQLQKVRRERIFYDGTSFRIDSKSLEAGGTAQ